ncbi:LmeA family phospholipid-binding protein [Streptomyces mirabilis]
MKRRWIKVTTITTVILAGVGIAADRVAGHYAEQEAVSLVQEKYGYGSGSTDGFTHVDIHGFPFLTQAAGRDFDHVTVTAGNFTLNTSANAAGDYLNVQELSLDLHGVTAASFTARSAEANLVTGHLTLSYKDLSGVITRLLGKGGALTVSPAPGTSHGQETRLQITGTWDGRPLKTTGSLLAQGNEIQVAAPDIAATPYAWRVALPQNTGFTTARSTPSGVDLELTGHQVILGTS